MLTILPYGLHKVDRPNLITYLNWTLILEWHVGRCGFKNRCQKDMFLKEIGLRMQNMLNCCKFNSPHNWGERL